MTPHVSRRLIAASGWLALVAIGGSLFVDEAWWGLTLAAVLLTAGLGASTKPGTAPVPRAGAGALAVALLVLLAATCAGLVATARQGFEPGWVGASTTAAGVGAVIAATVLGIGLVRRHRLTGVLVAAGLPVGLALDWVMGQTPAGFFLNGAGFYVGMVLFAGGLIRLGKHGISQTARHPTPATPRRRRYRSRAFARTL